MTGMHDFGNSIDAVKNRINAAHELPRAHRLWDKINH
jgi:hypothetical protein